MGIIGALLKHPEDLLALLKLKMASVAASGAIPSDPNLAFCYQMLRRVSRGFSVVIQQLDPGLRNAACVFYLVVRALNAVEDDISIPVDAKVPILKEFHKHINDPSWHFSCGMNDYKDLMDKFHFVSHALLGLPKGYQEVIEEIAERMGDGMAIFIASEVETVADYDEYCHYVAGLVGLGQSRLFYAGGLEDFAPDILSNSMGLFIQKTNIIRDYLEDINKLPAPRMFWPREIWGKYAKKLEDFKYEENAEAAVKCLNQMITNALSHATDCLQYMAAIDNPGNLVFCAIPQIMAMGTLAMCYNNIQVFRRVVEIRRGLTAKILEVKTMQDVYGAFLDFSSILATKVNMKDPAATLTLKHVDEIQQLCSLQLNSRRASTKESKLAHEAFLAGALLVLMTAMLLIVWRSV